MRRLRLVLKSFPGHSGRPGQRGGSMSRDRSKEVKQEFEESGKRKEDTRTYDEKKRDQAIGKFKKYVGSHKVAPKDMRETYRRFLQEAGVSEQFRVEELNRFERLLRQQLPQKTLRGDVRKALGGEMVGLQLAAGRSMPLGLRLTSARSARRLALRMKNAWEAPYD